MSAPLATLNSDCLGELLQLIDGNDFISLMMTGNRFLRHKLRFKCYSLSLTPLSTFFPSAAFELPNLRSLSVHGIKESATFLDFCQDGELALTRGHKTLEKIDLRFRNAAGVFFPLGHVTPRLPIRDRFPTLSTLIMEDFACKEPMDSLFEELPETLRTLHLDSYAMSRMDILSISKLPRHLTSLTLSGFAIDYAGKDDIKSEERLKTIFPPNLTLLELSSLIDETILNQWPSTLKTLRFIAQVIPSDFTLKASNIPPTLVELNVPNDDWLLELDAPLPSTLEIFDCPSVSGVDDSLTLDDMPAGIKICTQHLIESYLHAMEDTPDDQKMKNLFEKFPNLETASIKYQCDVACFPSRIKNLIFEVALPVSSPLPKTLKTLEVRAPLTINCIKNVPVTLDSLTIATARFESDYCIDPDFPTWTASEVTQLVENVRLVCFSIEMLFMQDPTFLSPLSGMKTLKTFIVQKAPINTLHALPNWLPQCLPTNLNALELYFVPITAYGGHARLPENAILNPDDFLGLCDLDEVTPHLKSLILECSLPVAVNFGDSFSTLPRELLKFCLKFDYADLEPNVCCLLPRTLRTLRLEFKNQVNNPVSAKHFEGVPEALSEIVLRFAPGSLLDPKLLEILPKSLISIGGIAETSYDREKHPMEQQRKNFLNSNALFPDYYSSFFV